MVTVEVEGSRLVAMDGPGRPEYCGGPFGYDQNFDQMGMCGLHMPIWLLVMVTTADLWKAVINPDGAHIRL